MSRRVIAIVDWRAAAALKENLRFIQQAGERGTVRPRAWRDAASEYRSLTLWEDGTCELQRFSAATVARRVAGPIESTTAWKARTVERG